MKTIIIFCLGCVIGYITGCMWMINYYSMRPSALDVYQGKTTIEITYREGVAIDSVIVFK